MVKRSTVIKFFYILPYRRIYLTSIISQRVSIGVSVNTQNMCKSDTNDDSEVVPAI